MKRTAKIAILDRLARSDKPLACHELQIFGYSENCLATRLSELAREGVVIGKTRPGKAFKEWAIRFTTATQTTVAGEQWPHDLQTLKD